MLLVSLGLVVIFLFGVAAALLCTPLVVTVQTRNRRLKIRWLGILEYSAPWPGITDHRKLTIGGMSVPLPAPAEKSKPKKPAAPHAAGVPKLRARFLWRCLRDSEVRNGIRRQLLRLGRQFFRAMDWRWQGQLCLADPAANGVLFGFAAATSWGRRAPLRMNFWEESSLELELRLYPHRLFRALARFLLGLPYRAIFRQWRASKK